MKLKYFLRGLGIGILVTTLVLCISYRKQNSDSSVMERARELGMEFRQKTGEPMLSPSPSPGVAASSAAATEEPIQNVATPQPVQTEVLVQTEVPVQTAVATNEPVAASTERPHKKEDAGKTHTFVVRGGLLSSSVAREMKAAGVIKDDEALDVYLEKNGLARKVRAGKYKIPIGASYGEIAKIITRQD